MPRVRLTDILAEISTHRARLDTLEAASGKLHALLREAEADAANEGDADGSQARTIARLERELDSVLARRKSLCDQIESLQQRAHDLESRAAVTRAVRAPTVVNLRVDGRTLGAVAASAPTKPATPSGGDQE